VRRVIPLFALAVMALATACGDNQPTTPRMSPGQPSNLLSDGSQEGNADFFFLPPIAPDPKGHANYTAGKFNANLAPVVRICEHPATIYAELSTLECDSAVEPVAEILTAEIRVAEEMYHVVWHTGDANLVDNKFYRVQVFVGTTRLGFADLTISTSKGEAKSAITNEVFPMNADRSVPIKFRIESGALGACKVTADCTEVSVKEEGGTFFTATKLAGVQLEDGWASQAALALGGGSIALTIQRVAEKDGKCHGGTEGVPSALGKLYQELDGCYHYKTDPDLHDPRIPEEFRGFQTEGNKVAQCTREAPAEDPDADYMLFKSDPGERIKALRDVPEPAGLDCSNFAFYEGLPSNRVLRLASMKWRALKRAVNRAVSVKVAFAWDGGLGGLLELGDGFSDISRGKGVKLAKAAGDNQSAPSGEQTPLDPTVRITSVHVHEGGPHEHPVQGAVVTFTAQGGGNFGFDEETEQPITTKMVATDGNGEASVPWRLGSGPNTVLATAATVDPAPVTFSATVATPLISCPSALRPGDLIDRGFYVPEYPGASLSRVDLYVAARPRFAGGEPADAAGVYALSLTARLNTYDGTTLGTGTASVTLTGNSADVVPISFSFPSVAVPDGQRVTFALTYVTRPEGGEALYDVQPTSESCPIVQTNGTAPPLDSFRRNGIAARIWGAAAPEIP
jgi:hypothetical protein